MTDDMKQRIGRIGIWMPDPASIEAGGAAVASAIEAAGFGSLWVGGGNGKPDSFERLAELLEGTTRLVVATGIANIWARPAAEMRAGAEDLAKRFPGRFILGLGVSHAPIVEGLGKTYEKPFQKMVSYLDELGDLSCPLVLAALGPRMLELSRDRTDGAHPYFVTPEHTAVARDILGPDPLLIPEQAVVLSGDRAQALAGGRAYADRYLKMPNYISNLKRYGFSDADISGGGSDRLIEAIIPYGPGGVTKSVRAHLDAGADHVTIQPLGATGTFSAADLHLLGEALQGLL
ncbi:MAG: TIGR03620 family F420-dependent LLM class oxidoreductase [Streptosporangiaceae bacterium]|jgi:probable F420-dependent oxidoreductase